MQRMEYLYHIERQATTPIGYWVTAHTVATVHCTNITQYKDTYLNTTQGTTHSRWYVPVTQHLKSAQSRGAEVPEEMETSMAETAYQQFLCTYSTCMHIKDSRELHQRDIVPQRLSKMMIV